MGARQPPLLTGGLFGAQRASCVCAIPGCNPTVADQHGPSCSPMSSWSNPTPRYQRLLPSLSRSRRNVLARGAFALSRARSARAPPRPPADWSSGPLTFVPRIDLYRGIFAPFRLPAAPRRAVRAREGERARTRSRCGGAPKFSCSRAAPLQTGAFQVQRRCAMSVSFHLPGRGEATSSRGTQTGREHCLWVCFI